jgi:acylphosphatase
MEGSELLELSAIVKGNVQRVGFRATAKLFADHLKLTGFVRNLPDGNVEICAQGGKLQLEKFLAELKQEFPSHYIEKIICDFRPTTKIYSDFRIVR